MIARSTNPGTSLALFAVCLQVVVAALSGQICVRMAPLPVSVSDSCQSGCCDEQDSSKGNSLVAIDVKQLPALPADENCCIEVSNYYFTNSARDAGMEDSDASFPMLHALVPHTPKVEISNLRVRANGPGDTYPPPSMMMIRSTVLRI